MTQDLTETEGFIPAIKQYLRRMIKPLAVPVAGVLLRSPIPSPSLKEVIWQQTNQYFAYDGVTGWAKTLWGDDLWCTAHDFVQKHIYFFGQWEPHLTRYIRSMTDCEGVFLDIGANIGYYSLLASHHFPQVIAFEPAPQIYNRLRQNIARNQITNIETHNLAIGDEEGDVQIVDGPSHNIGTTSVHKTNTTSPDTIRMAPLNAIINEETLAQIRFIKIDVEGFEPAIIQNLLPSLHKMHPRLEIALEVTPSPDPKTQQAVERMFLSLQKAGFHAHKLAGPYQVKDYLHRQKHLPPTVQQDIPISQTDILFSKTTL